MREVLIILAAAAITAAVWYSAWRVYRRSRLFAWLVDKGKWVWYVVVIVNWIAQWVLFILGKRDFVQWAVVLSSVAAIAMFVLAVVVRRIRFGEWPKLREGYQQAANSSPGESKQ